MNYTFFLSILFSFILFTSCNVNKEPEFIKLDKIQFLSIQKGNVNLRANAIFKNINDIGATVKNVDIDVFIREKKITKATSNSFEVDANKEFKVPLEVSIPIKAILGKNSGFLGTLLNSVKEQEIPISYKGLITFELGPVEYDYELDEKLPINLVDLLKKNKE